MTRLTISRRIGLATARSVGAIVVIGLFATWSLLDVRHTATEIRDVNVANLSAATRLSALGRENIIDVEGILLARTADEIAAHEANIAKAHDIIAENVAVLEQSARSDTEKSDFAAFLSARKDVIKWRADVIAAARANDHEAALALFEAKLSPAMADYLKTLGRFEATHRTSANESARGIEAATSRAIRAMALLSVALVAFNVLLGAYLTKSIMRPLRRAMRIVAGISRGDLTVRAEAIADDEFGAMINDMNAMAARLSEIVGNVRTTADELVQGSANLASRAQSLADVATGQQVAAESTARSMERMRAIIRHVLENAETTEAIAQKAADGATTSGVAVSDTLQAIHQIAKKIGVVEEIATKTDLLALNAALEAVRAGEHGTGFGVVATAVRRLAEGSQAAARESKELTRTCVAAGEGANAELDSLVPHIRQTADLVVEISASCVEQELAATEVEEAMLGLEKVMGTNSAASLDLTATARQLSGQAEQMRSAISFFEEKKGGDAAAVRGGSPLA